MRWEVNRFASTNANVAHKAEFREGFVEANEDAKRTKRCSSF